MKWEDGKRFAEKKEVHAAPFQVRTDLAREAHDLAREKRTDGSAVPGVRIEEDEDRGIRVSWIWVENDEGSRELGKKPGTYLTLEVPGLRSKDSKLQHRVAVRFAEEFGRFLKETGVSDDAKVLIVGLGNWNVTADALGPFVVKHIMVTRHLFELMPEQVEEGYRPVSAVSPGVLGITGIETSEIVHGIVEKTRPDLVIAIDSLASRSLTRVNTTIQVADSGINPGSGVGNRRKALTKETLGVPVIAVGVPTVVDAVTIVHDTLNLALAYLKREMGKEKSGHPLDPVNLPDLRELEEQEITQEMRSRFLGLIGGLSPEEKRQLIHEVLTPLGQNLIVTPKEVDAFVADIGKVVADGLNCALHEAVTIENVSAHTAG
ncbi:spore protease [Planifilum fulgidum]|uniref:Germination protease n=1 Tax=Planifilum fulgidum TaxID=201973 RepID=A0A1I2KTV0_9BACL|nr:GPR endopeptidase [Planifilum fulgidum]MBO2495532.1 GPR endopeptidase [Bacillota bacterium]SFF68511.1 spore protease [Planifilum fulgidum]